MKYGVVVFKKTANMGDDIQSYAASRFLPRVDYYIDREHIDSFYSEGGEPVAVIMGGWYNHSPLNWPPSPYIYPLLVSMHLTQNFTFAFADKKINSLDNKVCKEWFKRFSKPEGVGCRDFQTEQRLNALGIKTWWSGCITLTLEKFENVQNHGYIVCVDCSPEMICQIQRKTTKKILDVTHLYDCARPLEERFDMVEELLKLYQGASLVVTSRLHAALPSTALGTPVLYVINEKTDDRFENYLSYFPCVNKTDVIEGNIKYDFDNPIAVKPGLIEIGKRLSDLCKCFIQHCETANISISAQDIFLQSMNHIERLKEYIYSSKCSDYIDTWTIKENPYSGYANALYYMKNKDYQAALLEFQKVYDNLYFEDGETVSVITRNIEKCLECIEKTTVSTGAYENKSDYIVS